ncbi:LacI family DNA-binding transcriptional regulator [Orenia marismortui]|uniref:LacI family DNA-binding transcriptional regulator n=1 Tax=Orenia marismortui TaxID=46469 RepID=UPI00035F6F7F|nr:LacI family DNA-binding transcriptional regulator [Orenia marismortui]
MGNVTIYDVAELAEVGIGTVSRVLNNSARVSKETRNKVLEVIKKLNYQPNAMARGLALQKTASIGILISNFTSHFFMEVLKGVQQGLKKYNMDLVLYTVSAGDFYDITRKENYIDRILSERRVDGVLAITMQMTEEEINKFKSVKVPLVLVNDLQESNSSVFVDDIEGAKEAVNYLISLSHERIAFINGCMDCRQGKQRLRGFKEALKEANIEIDDNLIKIGDFNEESGYNLMKEILEETKENLPTAIFTASDIQAIGALKAIKEAGYSVPDDFSLIGYDNIELSKHLDLTTIAQPMSEMGELGVEMLMKSINSQQNEIIKRELVPNLVVRDSCSRI